MSGKYQKRLGLGAEMKIVSKCVKTNFMIPNLFSKSIISCFYDSFLSRSPMRDPTDVQ